MEPGDRTSANGLDMGIAGLPALVTGAGSGIGKATAGLLARLGSPVAIVDLNGAAAQNTADEIVASGGRAIAITADVTSEQSAAAALADAEAKLGVIRILVNNAGIGGGRRPMLEMAVEDWKRVIDVNLTAVFIVTQAVARRMVDAGGGGAIVNVSSVSGLSGVPNLAAYTASKHGVAGLTRVLAMELAEHQIRVNAVAPGIVATGMTMGLLSNPEIAAHSAAVHPLGRVAEPGEIADAIVYLASQRASFVTGSVVTIDGGFLAGKVA